jgi:ATP-binding cassette subfamily B protein
VREEFEKIKFAAVNSDLVEKSTSALKVMLFMQPVSAFAVNAATLGVVWVAGKQIMVGDMELGTLTAFITYLSQVLTALNFLANIILQGTRAAASDRRISEVLNAEIDLTDDKSAYPDKKIENGNIEFKNVSFRYYKNREEKVLDGINLSIKSGSTVGIIGSTGCGKTTLVSMIPRLYDADEGEVLIDGINVKDYSLVNLRDCVGMVLQKNLLFSGSISENLRWGDENADDDELKRFSNYAAADKFVSSFKEGYATMLDKGGMNLSGGQKQRLCIARALLKKPKILILDDSTSAVDTATESQIRYALANSLPECTKIIIAQRISSVMDAQQIIVMNDGVITGIGTHEELLKNNTEYLEIYNSQMDKKEA